MKWTTSDYSALGFICGLVIVDAIAILRAYVRARREDKRRMVKYYCDLCGQEITDYSVGGVSPYGRRARRFAIKELRWNEGGTRKEWQEIIAHDDCIKEILTRAKCEAHETQGDPKC